MFARPCLIVGMLGADSNCLGCWGLTVTVWMLGADSNCWEDTYSLVLLHLLVVVVLWHVCV